ncbi:YiiD C-terminal domain-containing protein [Roseibacillus persicicus]|uniref:YiiD C-terminal domain-containing protein n=1 Tax=Roseibacillus persicicus TaxID=454148 RepID=UPI00280FA19C|nr:YiiD C-terminal domain-containing protein [Roseibacillus persicicus]MDQ8191138.1 YiiD C-terminal domain-containing protein [Roseibacillus persicicus]
MITVDELTDYLHLHIPLSAAMGVTALQASSSEVRLNALFEPNINHQATVFGGSASAVAILAAWSLMHVRLREAGLNCELVIQRNSMEYLLPFDKDFEAVCTYVDEEAWLRFLKLYERRGRARLVVQARLFCEGDLVGELEGAFVALKRG